jgi:signal transduction histidine kinase
LASHELRTPLTYIKGYASTLLRRDVDWDEETRIDFLQTINAEADRLGRLVSDMLDVSRIELDRLEIRLRPIDLVDIASNVAKRVATTTERHRFTFYSKDDFPMVNGDRDRVEQVLHNLYSNAVKYSPNGGEIKTHINYSSDCTALEVAISDQGVGIPQDKVDAIFDRFFRIHDPDIPETGGTGLGLYITRNLVHAMGGTIRVQSTHSKGSTFIFGMPLLKNEREAAI